jgi:cytochrome c oxidase accessory protein FixG
MTRARSYGSWRRAAGIAQAALFLALPFVRVHGQSVLRLDVPAGRLDAFGASLAIDEAFVVLAATLVATFAFLLLTLVLGRAWCGWSCPQTVLSDLTSWVAREDRARPRRWRRPLGFGAVALLSALFSAAFLWYFVPPEEFLARLWTGRLGPVLSVSWAALGAVLLADLVLVRQVFCATVCPYARLQGVLLDRSSLIIAYDRSRAADCIDCDACVRVCPTGIDIRDGLQMECIACAACIDACQPIMRKLGRAPDLVGYLLGEPAGPGAAGSRARRLLRPAALALAGATVLSAGLLASVVAGRPVLELQASPEAAFTARRGEGGRTVNAFLVEIENRTRAPVTVALRLEADPPGRLEVRPDLVTLGPGERRHLRALVGARGLPPGRTRARLVGEVRDGDRPLGREVAEVSIVVPEGP